ncbi:MAG: hypothetical protein AAGH15_05775, partial [Myxococcota bacterium]
ASPYDLPMRPRPSALLLASYLSLASACGSGGDAADADAGASAAEEVLDAGRPPENVALADRLVATWTGIEEGEAIGTLRATYSITEAGSGRFDITQQGLSTPKFFILAGEAATPTRAYARIPDQVYSPGQTGPVTLELSGTGAFGADAPGGPYDAVYDLDADTFSVEAAITVRGSTNGFTFDFSDPMR